MKSDQDDPQRDEFENCWETMYVCVVLIFKLKNIFISDYLIFENQLQSSSKYDISCSRDTDTDTQD